MKEKTKEAAAVAAISPKEIARTLEGSPDFIICQQLAETLEALSEIDESENEEPCERIYKSTLALAASLGFQEYDGLKEIGAKPIILLKPIESAPGSFFAVAGEGDYFGVKAFVYSPDYEETDESGYYLDDHVQLDYIND